MSARPLKPVDQDDFDQLKRQVDRQGDVLRTLIAWSSNVIGVETAGRLIDDVNPDSNNFDYSGYNEE